MRSLSEGRAFADSDPSKRVESPISLSASKGPEHLRTTAKCPGSTES